MNENPFGTWLQNPGQAAAHYYLPDCGVALCLRAKKKAGATGLQYSNAGRNGNVITPFCRVCKQMNTARWGDRNGKPEGKACSS